MLLDFIRCSLGTDPGGAECSEREHGLASGYADGNRGG
tara:strand:- start:5325 stop:5438 length:114 start_codon:yes stop_codon:yes gene_type:complete